MVKKNTTFNNNNIIELKVLQNIYETTIDENGVEDYKLLKKDIISKQLIYKEDIKSIKEEITKYGKVYKTRCTVLVNGSQPLTIKENYNTLKQKLFNNPIPNNVGFKFY